ncbi:metal-sensing transcriptional repressor [Lentibacillus kimchii]|uniref:Metal-sensing transcriptional repressor n=1 Tax=Lentibacillus kimchii TaxID=1542911 RepID=A0ABW2UXW7_9BACI
MQSDKQPVMPRTDKEKDQMTNRLNRIEGQVRGLQKMIEEDRYCIDILVQISAVQAALNKVGYTVMERHAKTCVSDAIQSGNGDESIEELMKVIKQFAK